MTMKENHVFVTEENSTKHEKSRLYWTKFLGAIKVLSVSLFFVLHLKQKFRI